MKTLMIFLLASMATYAYGEQQSNNVVCSYAPSQSNLVAGISGAAGGASLTTSAVGSTLGLSAVTHSSGVILSGSSGYIAGTIGAASVLPVVLAVGLIVGGTAVTVEVICAKQNHPEQISKINAASEEFSRRFSDAWKRTKVAAGESKKSLAQQPKRPASGKTSCNRCLGIRLPTKLRFG
ncbi:MAG: hypothetical protein IPP59_14630 [Betaproteobacteria bacterium]|nr:hypothetical protein [Candidatus Dechloromonas phosphorivorans]